MSEVKSGFDSEFFTADIAAITEENNATVVDDNNTSIEHVSQKKFTREIDLGDGSGKQVFSADTLEGLVDEFQKAQTNATKLIRDQAKKLKVQPEFAEEPNGLRYEAPKPLTAEERRDLAEKFAIDPVTAIEQYLNGNPEFQAFKQFTVTQQAQIQNAAAETEFLTNIGDAFTPSPKNATSMINFLRSENLPYTAKNLEYAFQQLNESGLLEAKSLNDQGELNADGTKKVIVREHVRTKPQSTGVRSTHIASQRGEEEIEPNAVVDADVTKALNESDLDKARQLMLQAMSKQRKKASSL